MRWYEIEGQLRIPVSNEEHDLCNLIRDKDNKVSRDELDEHQQEIARLLVRREVIKKQIINGDIYFSLSKADMSMI